jgi:dihydropteroate synthase
VIPPLSSAFTPAAELPREFGGVGLLPLGILWGQTALAALNAGHALPLAGAAAFSAAGLVWRDAAGGRIAVVPLKDIPAAMAPVVAAIGGARAPWAGLTLDRPRIMGIINATPDSFSDGGDNFAPAKAIETALTMVAAGADIIDIGGESTRPGAEEVSRDAEIARVVPVINALAPKGVVVSIDTRHAEVMTAATRAGAKIINDVAGLSGPGALEAAAKSGAAVCLMHMAGDPRTMQDDPRYDCAPIEVYQFLQQRVAAAMAAGIPLDRITVDPGIGFGKTFEHNAQLLATQALLHGLGCGILLGASRKRFVAALSRDELPKQRFPGSMAAALAGLDQGVQILRVHDVAETVQAAKVWKAIKVGG